MRPATKLVQLANRHKSGILIKAHGKMADARSIIGIMLLCATFGTMIEVEISGEDEMSAVSAIEQLFEKDGDVDDTSTESFSVNDEKHA